MEPALWPVFHCHHFSKEVGSVQWLQSASCCATDPARSQHAIKRFIRHGKLHRAQRDDFSICGISCDDRSVPGFRDEYTGVVGIPNLDGFPTLGCRQLFSFKGIVRAVVTEALNVEIVAVDKGVRHSPMPRSRYDRSAENRARREPSTR